MTHLDPDRLALIALGEPGAEEEIAHLGVCDRCALDLAELEYTVTVGRSTVAVGDLESPPERVWSRIVDELTTSGEAPRPRWALRALVALAASIALIVGGVGVWTFAQSTRTVQVASTQLDAFPDYPGATGRAQVVEKSDGHRVIDIELSDPEPRDGHLEVWLLASDASALISLGELEDATGRFDVPADVDLSDYDLVDISQEPDDGDPTHSGDSIVRGQLAFA